MKTQPELKKYVDGDIYLKPFGLVFPGKDKNGKAKRFFFHLFLCVWTVLFQVFMNNTISK